MLTILHPSQRSQRRSQLDALTARLVACRYGDGTYQAARRKAWELLAGAGADSKPDDLSEHTRRPSPFTPHDG